MKKTVTRMIQAVTTAVLISLAEAQREDEEGLGKHSECMDELHDVHVMAHMCCRRHFSDQAAAKRQPGRKKKKRRKEEEQKEKKYG